MQNSKCQFLNGTKSDPTIKCNCNTTLCRMQCGPLPIPGHWWLYKKLLNDFLSSHEHTKTFHNLLGYFGNDDGVCACTMGVIGI